MHVDAFGQGSLTPPGAPSPTMKTLQQIEPRIDLQNAPASAVTTTNANYHYIITQPGSYYLSANVGATKTNGIQINAEGVTLDLNGFEISRSSGSGGNAIEIPSSSHRAAVRSGSIKGFAYGVNASIPRGCSYRDLAVSNCTSHGIYAGLGSVVQGCRAYLNSGTAGIQAAGGSTLTDCTVYSSTGSFGILADDGVTLTNCAVRNNSGVGIQTDRACTLTNCSASYNAGFYAIAAGPGSSLVSCTAFNNVAQTAIFGGDGSTLNNCSAYMNTNSAPVTSGISTGAGCTLSHCSAYLNTSTVGPTPTTGMGFDLGGNNTIHHSTASDNKGSGIDLEVSGQVANCTVSENGADGIRVSARSHVLNNECSNNAKEGLAGTANIHATGVRNRIEGNHVAGNLSPAKAGIVLDSNVNVITRNTVGGCSPNYSTVSGNTIYVIQAPTSGAFSGNTTAGTSFGASEPWANFSY